MNLFRKEKKSFDIEEQLLNTTLEEIFNMLHERMDEKDMPVKMGVMYQDVIFTISCDPVKDSETIKKEWVG